MGASDEGGKGAEPVRFVLRQVNGQAWLCGIGLLSAGLSGCLAWTALADGRPGLLLLVLLALASGVWLVHELVRASWLDVLCLSGGRVTIECHGRAGLQERLRCGHPIDVVYRGSFESPETSIPTTATRILLREHAPIQATWQMSPTRADEIAQALVKRPARKVTGFDDHPEPCYPSRAGSRDLVTIGATICLFLVLPWSLALL